MKTYFILSVLAVLFVNQKYPDPYLILNKVDKNQLSATKITEGKMIIYGKRSTREIGFRSYSEGKDKSFTEYLSPPKQRGTKMLKLKNNLWIYSPSADRTIQLSGHMLKQSMMGSDLSYQDMMEDRKLSETYEASIINEENIDNRKCWIINLDAKVSDVSYDKMKIWVDEKRYIVLKEELYAKSGQLLKRVLFSDIQKIGNRWYPKKMNFKDVLKNGKGTDFIVENVQFDAKIDAYIFTKAALRK